MCERCQHPSEKTMMQQQVEQFVGNLCFHATNSNHNRINREFDASCERCQIYVEQLVKLLQTAQKEAREEERERCAKAADSYDAGEFCCNDDGWCCGHIQASFEIARILRGYDPKTGEQTHPGGPA